MKLLFPLFYKKCLPKLSKYHFTCTYSPTFTQSLALYFSFSHAEISILFISHLKKRSHSKMSAKCDICQLPLFLFFLNTYVSHHKNTRRVTGIKTKYAQSHFLRETVHLCSKKKYKILYDEQRDVHVILSDSAGLGFLIGLKTQTEMTHETANVPLLLFYLLNAVYITGITNNIFVNV